jgi:hypothetical protein
LGTAVRKHSHSYRISRTRRGGGDVDPEPGRAARRLELGGDRGAFASPPCLPHDAALGNAGGDPYAFYVFNREEDLARLRASRCGPAATALSTAKEMPQAPVLLAGEIAQQAREREAARLYLASD